MKIIHTADIHLDSPLIGVKDAPKRRQELLQAFVNLAEYAKNNGVQAVVVAGDLFDDEFVTEQTIKSVAYVVENSPAQWFVVKGNHGSDKPYQQLQKLTQKIHWFGKEVVCYHLDGATICGKELDKISTTGWDFSHLDSKQFNLLVLHGDVDSDAYGQIDKRAIANSAINYVALGHRHAFQQVKFGKVLGAYCGVLEARGFDETQQTGFVVVDTVQKQVQFVPNHIRKVVSKQLDVSAISNPAELQNAILDCVADVAFQNYLNLQFVGSVEQKLDYKLVAQTALQGKYFALRLQDDTTLAVDVEQLKNEISLRGEFVKLCLEEPNPQLRKEMLELGLLVLSGGKPQQ